MLLSGTWRLEALAAVSFGDFQLVSTCLELDARRHLSIFPAPANLAQR